MSSPVKEFFSVAKRIDPKAELFECAYKLYDSSKSVDSLFKSLYNKISLSDTYNEFIKYQKVTYALIGKSDTV